MRFISTIFISLCFLSGYSQTTITGKLLNSQQQPVANVSVSYKKVGAVALSGFSKTDNQGKFELSVKFTDADSIQLDFNHMSYAKKSVVVANRTANYVYILRYEVRHIEEVKVADIPIYRRKDTITYSVDAFTSKQDRVIADIIKKLPGIEMDGNRILYQGKPIQKYMVNKLDLMEGRYGMINNNLPADAVKSVQVVENDQPIKILDSLVFSDRASLNLELKKFTTTGTGKAGAGFSPALWDLNLTPMTFGKTFQMLNSFQTNNMGVDVAKDLNPFYTGGGYLDMRVKINDGPGYISLRDVSSPDFDEKRWLDNKIFLLNTNVLQKLEDGLEIKGNISYFDDTQKRLGYTETQYFTSDETIVNRESVDNRYRFNILNAGVLIEKNEKHIYFRNQLNYRKRWNSERGNLLFNYIDNILQRRNYTDEALLNSLSIARFIGKQLVNIRFVIEYHNTPQNLAVRPGQFQYIINAGEPYEQIQQQVVFRGLQWDNDLSFMRKVKSWTFAPKVGINYERNNLNTNVLINSAGENSVLGSDYINAMQNAQLALKLSLRLGWENQKWKFNLTTPYDILYYNVEQQGVKTLNNAVRNTFNPAANVNYLLNANNDIAVNVSGGRQYGGLNNFYNGFIISQYRAMQRYDARLLKTESLNSGINYNYKNTLKANFANAGYSYNRNVRDFIYTSQIDSLGRSTTGIGDRNSQNKNHNLSAGISRFFATIKTVAKLRGNMSWSSSDYLLNNVMAKQYTQNRSVTVELINNLSTVISGDYKTSLGYTTNKLAAGKQNRIFYYNHYLNFVICPVDNHSLIVNNSLYSNNIPGNMNQYFLDATYRYTIAKWKTDIEFAGINLLDNNNYIQQFSSDFELVQTSFQLRPRRFSVSTRFRF